MTAFDSELLALLDRTDEVRIETSGPDGSLHRTVIWVAVVDGRVLARSFRGARGRWYRQARANPDTALIVGNRRIETEALPATDPVSIEGLNQGLTTKYSGRASLDAMLVEEVLGTTLELRPR